ncbi:PIG-L deacetylase family protein [Streptomyces polygonati]|uniref:PIG-L deacetylase family protein n=1 Tax=Streptomyces polygonati TaxID=1617087 RepID=A0ABV8HQ85_9ACTN
MASSMSSASVDESWDELPPLPRDFRRVLVISAHPDDAEFAFGGSVARLVEGGSEVRYLVCTDGSLGGEDPGVDPADLGERRAAEQRAAAAHLGVASVAFLGLTDGAVENGLGLRRALSRAIRRHRPDLVLTHQPLRSLVFPIGASHPDHLAVGEAAMCAVFPDAGNPRAFPELLDEGLAPHKVSEIWVPGHEHTNFYVALAQRHAEAKLEAILLHESQFERSPSPAKEIGWVADRMSKYGRHADAGWAEGFVRVICATSAGPAD